MPTGPANVLVVDDDRAIQRLVADALTQQGFSVTVERDGEWALKAFEMKDFDAVVLDLLLPLVNGYEVARKIRQMPKGKTVPIVMISGVYKNELHQREAVQHYGAFAFLEKPFKLSALQDTLKAALKDRYPAPPPAPAVPSTVEAPPEEVSRGEQLAAEEAKEEVNLVEQTTRAPEPGTASVRGDFAQKAVPEVLAELHRWKASGALLCRRGTVKKIVYLRAGVPQFVKSNLLSECLGRIMVKERLLSQADCEESLRRMKASKRQQGAVLIEMGVISPNNLAHALNLQQRVKLFEVFGWTTGQYHFSAQKDLPPETINLDMTAAALIAEGVKRSYDKARVTAALGTVGKMFVHPADDPLYALQDLGLGEEEQLLLQAVDGRKSLDTLRALDLLSPLDTDRLLYSMRCAGVVAFKPTAAEKAPSISFKGIAQSAPQPTPAPPPLPPRREPGASPTEPDSWSYLDGNGPVAAPRPPPDQATTAPTAQTADLLQNATARSGPVSTPFVEISGSHSVAAVDEALLRERLAGRVAAMRKQDHYEILGVPTAARPEDIHESYLVLAREFHPDKLANAASAEIRQFTEQIYNLVTLAHDTLMDPLEREHYRVDLAAGNVKPEVGSDVSKILTAEGKFQRGEEQLRQKAYAEAYASFSEAVELYGEEGEFHAFKGWARFQMDPQKHAVEALREIERAVQLNPKSDRTYLFAGHIHKATGRTDLAEQQFEKAIQVNPSCNEAFQELSLLSWASRLGKGKGKG
ncbi:MAG TPA: response regulator [Myxococcaceae bacterium]|jgi:DNA-binding response OmpR family regulator/curved DNA-binding protein CbpA